jgi:hypothetical protein
MCVASLLCGRADAGAVSTVAVLSGSGLATLESVTTPALAGVGGSLIVTVRGDFSTPGNSTVFAGLDSFAIGSVREVQNFVSAGVMKATFSITNMQLDEILRDGVVRFAFNSRLASSATPYTVSAQLVYASVPEPTTIAVLGLGGIGLFFVRKRKK